MIKLSISNKYNNKRIGMFNTKSWRTVKTVGIGEINYQFQIWIVTTRVKDVLFILSFLSNNKKVQALYWMRGNNSLYEDMNYNTQF